jgi:hypothetical protein
MKAELTKEERQEWDEWLSERPDNVRKVAERIVPWKKYRLINEGHVDVGNRYVPRSYDEHADGSVTLTCEKSNEECPLLGGYGVFGMHPDELIESE